MRIFPPWLFYDLLQKEPGRCWFPSGAPQVGHDSNLLFTFLIGGGDRIAWRQMFVRYLKNKHPPTTELMCPRLASFHNYYFYPCKEPATCVIGGEALLQHWAHPQSQTSSASIHSGKRCLSLLLFVAFDVGSVTRKSLVHGVHNLFRAMMISGTICVYTYNIYLYDLRRPSLNGSNTYYSFP